MYIDRLALHDFRNHRETALAFSRDVNVITGGNGQGKTNLLESVALLSMGRSFRTVRDAEMINTEAQRAYVKALIDDNGVKRQFEALLCAGQKSIRIDAQPLPRLSELYGNFLCVVFCPDDIGIISDAPPVRRRFMDTELVKLKPAYYGDLKSYYTAMREKNALLREGRNAAKLRDMAAIYNEQLATAAARIVKSRAAFCESLSETLPEVYRSITGEREDVALRYKACATGDVAAALMEKYERGFESELEMHTTLYGIHREDIAFELDGADARVYASQGQRRTLTVALKLAVAGMMTRYLKREPVIFLDDIFSELDATRQRGLLDCVAGRQLILTTANPESPALAGIKKTTVTIADGRVV